jgi:hypothetical protein
MTTMMLLIGHQGHPMIAVITATWHTKYQRFMVVTLLWDIPK